MERHSFSQALWYMEQIIVPVGKEANVGMPEKGDAVFIICPVDQHSAPDHNGQDREIYPVCPSHCQRMFFFNDFHSQKYSINIAVIMDKLPKICPDSYGFP